MWAIFKRDFRDRRVATLVYCGISAGLLLMYVALFPSIKAQSSNYQQLFSSFPEAFQKAFNFDTSIFSTLEGFLATEKFSITWQMLVILLTLSRAGRALAGEIERGTIGLLLATPVNRIKLYWAKYMSGLGSLVVFVLVSSFGAILFAALFHIDIVATHYFTLFVICLLFGWAIYATAMMASAFASDRSTVYFIVGGALVVMYVAEIVSKLKEGLAFLSRYSIFHYFDVQRAFIKGQWAISNMIVLIIIIIIASVAGAYIFNKRDIASS